MGTSRLAVRHILLLTEIYLGVNTAADKEYVCHNGDQREAKACDLVHIVSRYDMVTPVAMKSMPSQVTKAINAAM